MNETLAHNVRSRLSAIIGMAELLRDRKAGAVSELQDEFLGDILTSGREVLLLLEQAVGSAPAAVTGPAVPAVAPDLSVPLPVAQPPRPPVVLVVGDDARDRAQLESALRAAGFDVRTAETGAEAVAQARAGHVDAITLDLDLPDMAGWQVLQRLVEDGTAAPCVVVSTTPSKMPGGGRHVVAYVAKPSTGEDVVTAPARAGVRAVPPGPVLIVDNNPLARKLASLLLAHHGYRVVACPGGAAAAAEPPAAVILDLLMPEMSGVEFLEHFRRTDTGAKTPVIVWSVKHLDEDERRALAAEAVVSKREDAAGMLVTALGAVLAAGARS